MPVSKLWIINRESLSEGTRQILKKPMGSLPPVYSPHHSTKNGRADRSSSNADGLFLEGEDSELKKEALGLGALLPSFREGRLSVLVGSWESQEKPKRTTRNSASKDPGANKIAFWG